MDNTDRVRAVRAKRLARMLANDADRAHGTIGGYDAGCRCEDCHYVRVQRYWRQEGVRHHAWREYVTEVFRDSRDAWDARRESYEWMNWERDDFAKIHPPPTFKAILVGAKGWGGHGDRSD